MTTTTKRNGKKHDKYKCRLISAGILYSGQVLTKHLTTFFTHTKENKFLVVSGHLVVVTTYLPRFPRHTSLI